MIWRGGCGSCRGSGGIFMIFGECRGRGRGRRFKHKGAKDHEEGSRETRNSKPETRNSKFEIRSKFK